MRKNELLLDEQTLECIESAIADCGAVVEDDSLNLLGTCWVRIRNYQLSCKMLDVVNAMAKGEAVVMTGCADHIEEDLAVAVGYVDFESRTCDVNEEEYWEDVAHENEEREKIEQEYALMRNNRL